MRSPTTSPRPPTSGDGVRERPVRGYRRRRLHPGDEVSIPAAVSRFPREIIPVPRSWAERAYPNLVYFNRLEKGGHFAAWEQPELFAGEMRAAFRSPR
jgi:pimeloyl-ACP methyl ester carboxylesterase